MLDTESTVEWWIPAFAGMTEKAFLSFDTPSASSGLRASSFIPLRRSRSHSGRTGYIPRHRRARQRPYWQAGPGGEDIACSGARRSGDRVHGVPTRLVPQAAHCMWCPDLMTLRFGHIFVSTPVVSVSVGRLYCRFDRLPTFPTRPAFQWKSGAAAPRGLFLSRRRCAE